MKHFRMAEEGKQNVSKKFSITEGETRKTSPNQKKRNGRHSSEHKLYFKMANSEQIKVTNEENCTYDPRPPAPPNTVPEDLCQGPVVPAVNKIKSLISIHHLKRI